MLGTDGRMRLVASDVGRASARAPVSDVETAALAARLRVFLGSGLADGDVADLRRLSYRWQVRTYRFRLVDGLFEGDWILRLYEGSGAIERCQQESQLVANLGDLGFPVPQTLAYGVDTQLLGQPFQILRDVAGHTLADELSRSQGPARQRCIQRFMALLAHLHRLPLRQAMPEGLRAQQPPADRLHVSLLTQAKTLVIDTHGLREFEPLLAWIDQACAAVRWGDAVVVHNDFHPGNILCGPDGVDRLIDWTTVGAADHRYDLGWTLMLTAAYQGRHAYEAVFDAYRQAWGRSIESIDVFVLVAAVRRLLLRGVPVHAAAHKMGMPGPRLIDEWHEAEHLRSVCALIGQISGLRLPGVERVLDSLR